MYTNFRTLSLNIHVGCCLFSHKFTKTTQGKHTVGLTHLLYLSVDIVLQCDYFQLAQLCNTKKNGAHTHAHHLSHSLFSIFTSVVVYSRTKSTDNKHKKSIEFWSMLNTLCVCCIYSYILTTCTVVQPKKKKKNAKHTHMHTIFHNFLAQYSRRLLSILAQHKQKQK